MTVVTVTTVPVEIVPATVMMEAMMVTTAEEEILSLPACLVRSWIPMAIASNRIPVSTPTATASPTFSR